MVDIFDIRDKCAWVTGASHGGLGYYHALTLAKQGANVAVSDLPSRAGDLAKTKIDLEQVGVNVLPLQVDVSSEEEVVRAVGDIEKKFGRIDILVNNAGTSIDKPAVDMPLADWNHVVNVNLTGPWLCARTVCRLMRKMDVKGKIINIASTYGRQADLEPSAPYFAAKAAVINLTRALAVEWAPYGIYVNAIAPGYFPSRMTRFVEENPEVKRRFLSRIILKRAGDPAKDLAGALLYLASEASDYVTGQTIFVDGGWTAT
jgi:gluconate 5-dehydrogenase